MRVVLTGSHGLIGSALARSLKADGHNITSLVRGNPGPGETRWDPERGTIADPSALAGHDAIVNLAGAGIGDHRWTDSYKPTVLDGRVNGTRALAEAIGKLDHPPRVFVSGSAVGYYGDRGDEVLTEASPPGTGFLADVVKEWEAATAPAREGGIRVVNLRTGIVMSRQGGALKKQLLPFKLGVGGRLGSGRQYLSWVAIDDEVGAIRFAIDNEAVSGPINATAPNPVTNAQFTEILGRVLHRPTLIPVPLPALRLVLGRELVREMIEGGQRVLPAALEARGYKFRYAGLEDALAGVLRVTARA